MKKKNKRKVTKRDKSYKTLPANEKLAIDMRVQNYSSRDIADKCGVEEGTVRNWFMTEGRLHSAYVAREAEIAEEREKRFQAIDMQIQEGASDAVITLRKKAKAGNISAAEILLEYSGKAPAKKLDVKTPPQVNVNFGDILDELTQSKSDNNKQANT